MLTETCNTGGHLGRTSDFLGRKSYCVTVCLILKPKRLFPSAQQARATSPFLRKCSLSDRFTNFLSNATRLLRSTPSTFSPTSPSRTTACIYRPNDALSAPSPIPGRLKLWESLRSDGRGCPTTWWGRSIRTCIRRLHERSDGPNGLPSRSEGRDGRSRVHGTKCMFLILTDYRVLPDMRR